MLSIAGYSGLGFICRVDQRMVNLTPREREITELLLEGRNSLYISERLMISRHTVDTHRRSILRKLGVKNTPELIVYLVKNPF